jgi:hypothetical protein
MSRIAERLIKVQEKFQLPESTVKSPLFVDPWLDLKDKVVISEEQKMRLGENRMLLLGCFLRDCNRKINELPIEEAISRMGEFLIKFNEPDIDKCAALEKAGIDIGIWKGNDKGIYVQNVMDILSRKDTNSSIDWISSPDRTQEAKELFHEIVEKSKTQFPNLNNSLRDALLSYDPQTSLYPDPEVNISEMLPNFHFLIDTFSKEFDQTDPVEAEKNAVILMRYAMHVYEEMLQNTQHFDGKIFLRSTIQNIKNDSKFSEFVTDCDVFDFLGDPNKRKIAQNFNYSDAPLKRGINTVQGSSKEVLWEIIQSKDVVDIVTFLNTNVTQGRDLISDLISYGLQANFFKEIIDVINGEGLMEYFEKEGTLKNFMLVLLTNREVEKNFFEKIYQWAVNPTDEEDQEFVANMKINRIQDIGKRLARAMVKTGIGKYYYEKKYGNMPNKKELIFYIYDFIKELATKYAGDNSNYSEYANLADGIYTDFIVNSSYYSEMH